MQAIKLEEPLVKNSTLSRPRRLLLCLDGVPFEVVEAAKGRGLFDSFGNPTRLLSPFPTMTNVALPLMLKATPPLGYESLYFDRTAQEMRGGVRKYIGRRTPDKVPSSYMDELNYQEPLPFEFLVYVAPEKVWQLDFKRFHERFKATPLTQDFFAFLKGVDGLLHIRGRDHLDVALAALDKLLRQIQTSTGGETEIVLFSDHGMNLVDNKRVHLRTHLEKYGYSITDRLRASCRCHVAVPAFGLCGYAALYCQPDVAGEVASRLAELEGVDFSLYVDAENIVAVKGARGTARIHRQENEGGQCRYHYEQINGDPLQLNLVLGELEAIGEVDQRGYATDTAWYKVTKDHIYPDALANLYGAMREPRVRHTANVLISFHDGYYYGSSVFSRLARLRATHGNALRPSSNAFLMSTHRQFPLHVRASEATPLLKQ